MKARGGGHSTERRGPWRGAAERKVAVVPTGYGGPHQRNAATNSVRKPDSPTGNAERKKEGEIQIPPSPHGNARAHGHSEGARVRGTGSWRWDLKDKYSGLDYRMHMAGLSLNNSKQFCGISV